jgi:hypothetical protein
MAKKTAARRRAPDMSNYVSPRMQKGIRYLDGDHKASFISRVRKAFAKVRIRALAH